MVVVDRADELLFTLNVLRRAQTNGLGVNAFAIVVVVPLDGRVPLAVLLGPPLPPFNDGIVIGGDVAFAAAKTPVKKIYIYLSK